MTAPLPGQPLDPSIVDDLDAIETRAEDLLLGDHWADTASGEAPHGVRVLAADVLALLDRVQELETLLERADEVRSEAETRATRLLGEWEQAEQRNAELTAALERAAVALDDADRVLDADVARAALAGKETT